MIRSLRQAGALPKSGCAFGVEPSSHICSQMDLNHRPPRYKRDALTAELCEQMREDKSLACSALEDKFAALRPTRRR